MDIKKLDSEWKLDVQRHRASAANDRPKGGDANDSAGLPKFGSLHSNSPGVTAGAITSLSLAGEGDLQNDLANAEFIATHDGDSDTVRAALHETIALIRSLLAPKEDTDMNGGR